MQFRYQFMDGKVHEGLYILKIGIVELLKVIAYRVAIPQEDVVEFRLIARYFV